MAERLKRLSFVSVPTILFLVYLFPLCLCDIHLVYPLDPMFNMSCINYDIPDVQLASLNDSLKDVVVKDFSNPNRTLIIAPGIMNDIEDLTIPINLTIVNGTEEFPNLDLQVRKIRVEEMHNAVVLETISAPETINWLNLKDTILSVVGETKVELLAITKSATDSKTQIIFCLYKNGTEIHKNRALQADLIATNLDRLKRSLNFEDLELLPGKCTVAPTSPSPHPPCFSEIGYINDVPAVSSLTFISTNGTDMSVFRGLNLEWRARYIKDNDTKRGCQPGSCLHGGVCNNHEDVESFGFSCNCDSVSRAYPYIELGPRCELTARQLNATTFSKSIGYLPSVVGSFQLYLEYACSDSAEEIVVTVQSIKKSFVSSDALMLKIVIKSDAAQSYVNISSLSNFTVMQFHKVAYSNDWRSMSLYFDKNKLETVICNDDRVKCLSHLNSSEMVLRNLLNENIYVFQDAVVNVRTDEGNICIRNLRVNGHLLDVKDGYLDNIGTGCQKSSKKCKLDKVNDPYACGTKSVCGSGLVSDGKCLCSCMYGYRREYSSVLVEKNARIDYCDLDGTHNTIPRKCIKDEWHMNGISNKSSLHWLNATTNTPWSISLAGLSPFNLPFLQIKFVFRTLQTDLTLLQLKCESKSILNLTITADGFLRVSDNACKVASSYPTRVNNGYFTNVKLDLIMHRFVVAMKSITGAKLFVNSTPTLLCSAPVTTETLCQQSYAVPIFSVPESIVHSVVVNGVYLPSSRQNESASGSSLKRSLSPSEIHVYSKDFVTASWIFDHPPYSYNTSVTPTGSNISFVRSKNISLSLPAYCSNKCNDNEERRKLWRRCPCMCKHGFIRLSHSSPCVPLACTNFPFFTCPRYASCRMNGPLPFCICNAGICSASFCTVDMTCKDKPVVVVAGAALYWPFILVGLLFLLFLLLIILILCILYRRRKDAKEHLLAEKEILEVFENTRDVWDEGAPPEDFKGSVNFVFPRIRTVKTDRPNDVIKASTAAPVFTMKAAAPSRDSYFNYNIDQTLTYQSEEDPPNMRRSLSNLSLVSADLDDDVDFRFIDSWGKPFANIGVLLR